MIRKGQKDAFKKIKRHMLKEIIDISDRLIL